MVAVEWIIPVAREIEGSHMAACRIRTRAFAGVVQFIVKAKLERVLILDPAQIVCNRQPFIGAVDRLAGIKPERWSTGQSAKGHLGNEIQRIRTREKLSKSLQSELVAPDVVQVKVALQRAIFSCLAVTNINLVHQCWRECPYVTARVGIVDVCVVVSLANKVGR